MFEDSEKNKKSLDDKQDSSGEVITATTTTTTTTADVCEKKDKSVVEKSTEKPSNKITDKSDQDGNTSAKLEDKPKTQKGDLPKVPGKLNVKGFFKVS